MTIKIEGGATMIQHWVQANTYAKFILVLGLVLPVSMGLLAYKIEKMFPDETEKAPLAATK